MYQKYLEAAPDEYHAVRQMCRKLDLYWSETICTSVMKKATNRTLMREYMTRLCTNVYAGRSYDDTLKEENALWSFPEPDERTTFRSVLQQATERQDAANGQTVSSGSDPKPQEQTITVAELKPIHITKNIVSYWGPGYTGEMYQELEQRRQYWLNHLPEGTTMDVGMEALIRQLCNLEIDINRDRAAGKNAEKKISTLNGLIGSMNLKPTQKEEDNSAYDKTPFGVWIDRFEYHRPTPEPDPDFQDVDGIIRYITIWFLGHLCHMLGIKNKYCKLYEQEIDRMRVSRGDDDEEEDEEFFNRVFSDGESG